MMTEAKYPIPENSTLLYEIVEYCHACDGPEFKLVYRPDYKKGDRALCQSCGRDIQWLGGKDELEGEGD